jgi:hypothetical protein
MFRIIKNNISGKSSALFFREDSEGNIYSVDLDKTAVLKL